MIRVTIELIPRGIVAHKSTLHVGEIWNDGSGTITTGNYGYRLLKKGRLKDQDYRRGRIEGFPRTRLGAWSLLHRCLQDAFNEEIQTDPEDTPACEESAAAEAQQTEADLEEKDRVAGLLSGAEEVVGRDPVLLALWLADHYRAKCELASSQRAANPRSPVKHHPDV